MKWVVVAVLGTALMWPVAAQADGGVDCRRNGKQIPADQCAWISMVTYAQAAYLFPQAERVYRKRTVYGRFHSVWSFQIAYPGGKLMRFRLSAKSCSGHNMVVFDHRQQAWWPHAC